MSRKIATVSYDGGGWTIPYLIGVSAYLHENRKDIDDSETLVKYAGVSAGSCVALASALGVSMDDLMSEVITWADICRPCPLLTLQAVRFMCNKMIVNEDQVESLNESHSFALGVTRVIPGKMRFKGDGMLRTVVASRFDGKGDLVEKVVSSCRLPMINTLPPINGVPYEYIDGNLLTRFIDLPWHSDVEIRVSPNKDAKGSDVSFQEDVPIPRHIVPYDKAGLRRMYDAGKLDGREVVRRMQKISCEKILPSEQESKHTNDRSTSFYKRLHVDCRRYFCLPQRRQEGPARAQARAQRSIGGNYGILSHQHGNKCCSIRAI